MPPLCLSDNLKSQIAYQNFPIFAKLANDLLINTIFNIYTIFEHLFVQVKIR